MNGEERCPESMKLRFTVRHCDLPTGHDGPHVTSDSQGRSEYYWPQTTGRGK